MYLNSFNEQIKTGMIYKEIFIIFLVTNIDLKLKEFSNLNNFYNKIIKNHSEDVLYQIQNKDIFQLNSSALGKMDIRITKSKFFIYKDKNIIFEGNIIDLSINHYEEEHYILESNDLSLIVESTEIDNLISKLEKRNKKTIFRFLISLRKELELLIKQL